MAATAFDAPETLGFDPARLDLACGLLGRWCAEDRLPAAALCVGRKGGVAQPWLFGRQRLAADSPPVRDDALFLVASITKPVTVTAVLMLVERGELTLGDHVARFLPDFADNGKADVQVRHLMTHTSGLPDQLPSNFALRRAHSPLSDFVVETCRQPLLHAPGTRVSYQSMGTGILAAIVQRITGRTLAQFLREEVFDPLGMHDTSLGWQPEKRERIAEVRVPPELERETDWNWNSAYWLGLGAPWGGLITSPADFARFCRTMLHQGALDGVRILSPASVRAMTANQLAALPEVPEEDRRCRPWGLGWRLNWPGHSDNFGDLLGPRAYGHWGATGTVCWIDPDTEAFCVLFTTRPQEPEGRYLARVCNLVASALMEQPFTTDEHR